MQYDLIIRGGNVVDGTGAPPFVGDVAVKDGLIAAVGTVTGDAAREIDAKGLLVTPGFVDVHTHYDGQAIWSERMAPSSSHGVTTVVMGNCGVGFAPCRPADHDLLVDVMSGVEDIPGAVMAEGLPWTWETFPEYLDALESRRRDIDVAAYMPHTPLRVYVMGDRGAAREPATAEDLTAMSGLMQEAVQAGALGFATSQMMFHKTGSGDAIPTYAAAAEELRAIRARDPIQRI
jgi:N-acyl-D-amino-acid deacylase